jgi:hypothetical protein
VIWEAVIERDCRYTWTQGSSEYGCHNRVSLDQYWKALDRHRAGCCDSYHQLVTSQLWECVKVTLHLIAHGERTEGSRACRDARRKLKLHSGVNTE